MIDGYVAFNSTSGKFSYDAGVTPSSGTKYFIGTAEHEISEVMGRISLLSTPNDIYASPEAHAAARRAHLIEHMDWKTDRAADQSAGGAGEWSGTRTRGASHLQLSAPYRRIDTRSTRRSCDNTSDDSTCGPKIRSTATRRTVKWPHLGFRTSPGTQTASCESGP